MLDHQSGVANLSLGLRTKSFRTTEQGPDGPSPPTVIGQRRTPWSSTMLPMLRFWVTYLALLLVLAVPVFVVARRRRRTTTIRNVATSALVIGGLMAMTRYTSDRAVEQCIDVGNTQCVDAGSTGILWLLAIGFTVVVWARAWNLRGR